jgi:hypothetical protein
LKGILFQENAAPHKAAIMHQKLADLHFEVLKHLAYSSDLAPSDYYLFIKPNTYQPPPCICMQYIFFSKNMVSGTLMLFQAQR